MTEQLKTYPIEELWLFAHNKEGYIQPTTPVNLGEKGVNLVGDELLKAIKRAKVEYPLPHSSWNYLPMVISISLEDGREIADIVM